MESKRGSVTGHAPTVCLRYCAFDGNEFVSGLNNLYCDKNYHSNYVGPETGVQ
jgi:hypothetical protein